MPETDSTTSAGPERINELYWSSDQTVDEIVKDLRITRSALYSAVQPAAAGKDCPDCGTEMVFTNRTNREAGAPACLSCDRERDRPAQAGPTNGQRNRSVMEPPSSWSRWRGELAAVPRERAAMVGGAAALGVVFGATAARIIQEMR